QRRRRVPPPPEKGKKDPPAAKQGGPQPPGKSPARGPPVDVNDLQHKSLDLESPRPKESEKQLEQSLVRPGRLEQGEDPGSSLFLYVLGQFSGHLQHYFVEPREESLPAGILRRRRHRRCHRADGGAADVLETIGAREF